ncbi:MAG: ATP-binding cassette domain-containing protein, partial [Tenericutes bacterium]|nr:ATP-binding cassette domain-containing protein [Mycoplasmatota bacterium]
FVFQSYNLIDSYTVLQNVEAPLILSGHPKDVIKKRAREIIRRVGLEDHIHHKATKLSGGQKQRVVIARALAKDCPIIVADEPTGNLDSDSARQIIELLAEIAKEKLVIVVTHDFSQVEEFATRKIRIFDGEIVEDLKIEKTDKLNLPEIPDEDHRVKLSSYLQISLRNLLSVPKKTLLMIVIFTFFSLFVALSYGAYQLATNEVQLSNNSHFTNTSPNRVVLRKMDGSELTPADLAEINDYNIVDQVVSFDYMLDYYTFMYSEDGDSYENIYGLYLPVSLIEGDDLDYGRLPTSSSEIVVAVNTSVLNNYEDDMNKTFYSADGRYYSDSSLGDSYKVVGMINADSLSITNESYDSTFIMVTDEKIEELRKDIYFNYTNASSIIGDTPDDDEDSIADSLNNVRLEINETLLDDQIKTSKNRYYGECDDNICYMTGTLLVRDYYVETEIEDITVIYDASINDYSAMYVNQATYDKIIYDDIYQVSIFTNTDIGVAGFVKDLQKINDGFLSLKYKVIYPFDANASNDFEALLVLAMNIGMIGLIIITMVGSTLITYVIFRAIINTKLHDYAIFRTIGANKKVIKSFIYLENLYVVLVSYAIFVTISLSVPADMSQMSLFEPLKVFDFWNFIVMFFLLISMSLVISRKYCNRIFRQSVQKTLKSDVG